MRAPYLPGEDTGLIFLRGNYRRAGEKALSEGAALKGFFRAVKFRFIYPNPIIKGRLSKRFSVSLNYVSV